MKKLLCIISVSFILIALHCPGIDARQFRNIMSVTNIDYENIGRSTVYENTFLAEVGKGFSLSLKGYHDKRSTWNNTIIFVGPVININKYHYVEINYGYGRNSFKNRADYYSIDFTREKPGYLLGFGYKHSVYPGYSYNTVSPSVKYYITPKIALWGKLFLSNDSDDNVNSAFWTDCEVLITRKISVRSGFVVGNRLYSPEYESIFGGRSDMGFSSFLAKVTYTFNERFSINYQYEQVSRQSEFTDKKNILLLDVRILR
jgi:hypothetical protein